MKIPLVLALAGLAISFAAPAFAQQKNTVDPKIAQQIRALEMKYDEALNRSDPGALAALYTEDAVRVTVHGTFSGRQAIAKDYAERAFQRYQSNNHVLKVDRVNAVGKDVGVSGKWTCAFHDTDGGDKHIDGHYSWVLLHEGDTWKIRKDTSDEGVGY
jgi:uncharacterized protein (TIGR02246 family)